jgi:hypothetical protein
VLAFFIREVADALQRIRKPCTILAGHFHCCCRPPA